MVGNDKGSILVVDDNVSQCETLSLILRCKGYHVATAKNGLEAVDAVRQRSFRVILMDIKMPIMNGVDAYRQMKDIRPNIVAIMMTAYAVDELETQALALGVSEIAYKPLDLDHLIAKIEKVSQQ